MYRLGPQGGQRARGLLKLVGSADAIICSVRPAAMERLGLGYEDCKKVNEKIVYVALVEFSQSGSLREISGL